MTTWHSECLHTAVHLIIDISHGVITGRVAMLCKPFLFTGFAEMWLLKCDRFSRRCFYQESFLLLNSKSCTKLQQKGPSKWQYNSFGLKTIKNYPNSHRHKVPVTFVGVFITIQSIYAVVLSKDFSCHIKHGFTDWRVLLFRVNNVCEHYFKILLTGIVFRGTNHFFSWSCRLLSRVLKVCGVQVTMGATPASDKVFWCFWKIYHFDTQFPRS